MADDFPAVVILLSTALVTVLDGKALRRALNQDQNLKVIVSAWAEDNALVLGQLKVDDKSNDHGCAAVTPRAGTKRLHRHAGCDGLPKRNGPGNQRVRCGVCFGLKGNQETVHREVQEFLDAAVAESKTWKPPEAASSPMWEKLASQKTVEKDHGRLEARAYYQSANLVWLVDLAKWEGLQSFGMVESTRELDFWERRKFEFLLFRAQLSAALLRCWCMSGLF